MATAPSTAKFFQPIGKNAFDRIIVFVRSALSKNDLKGATLDHSKLQLPVSSYFYGWDFLVLSDDHHCKSISVRDTGK